MKYTVKLPEAFPTLSSKYAVRRTTSKKNRRLPMKSEHLASKYSIK